MRKVRTLSPRGVVLGPLLGLALLACGCGGKPETGTQESSPELKQTLDATLDAAVENAQQSPQAN